MEVFLDISPLSYYGVLTAFLCGGIIGLERRLSGKPAGIRTAILICLGSYAFVALSVEISGSNNSTDHSRVLGQIITGIGFLGAGVMLNRGKKTRGVTTAAVIWVLAGIGAFIGFHKIVPAVVITAVTLFVLSVLGRLETLMNRLIEKYKSKNNQEYDDD